MNAQTQPPTKVKPNTAPPAAADKSVAKEPKAPKVAKAPKDPNAPKTPRGPRKDYGYSLESTIKLTDGEQAYRGQRLDWYNVLKQHNGKTVGDFLKAAEGRKDPGRGWLRFFVQDEAVTLIPPAVATPAAEAAKATV